MKTFLPVSALLTVVWAVTPAAFADPLTLPKTDVQASAQSDASTSGYQQPVDSSTTRLGLTPKETPQGVTSLSREQLNDFNLNSVKDALRSAPSVTVEQYETDRTNFTSRGFDIKSFEVRVAPVQKIEGLRPGMTVLFDWPQ